MKPQHPRGCGADAISVDQSDSIKKGQQVSVIGKIFQKAKTVRAWLGEEADGSSDLISKGCKIVNDRLFDKPCSRCYHGNGVLRTVRLAGSGLGLSALADVKFGHREISSLVWLAQSRLQYSLTSEKADEIKQVRVAIYSFFARPYWLRTWICQEVVLAQQLMFYCGHDRICSDDLFHVQSLIAGAKDFHQRVSVGYPCMDGAGRRIAKSHHAQRTRRREHPLQLARLLKEFGETNCVDPRDRVYALLPLAESMPNVPQLTVDYGIDRLVLFMRTMDVWLAEDSNLHSRDMHSLLAALELNAEEVIAGLVARPELLHHVLRYGYLYISSGQIGTA